MPISDNAKVNLNALSAKSPYVVLVDINHPTFEEIIHIVADTQDFIDSAGTLYKGLPLEITMPSDSSKNPSAQLEIDNVGKILTEHIEKARGLAGGTCRLRTIFRDHPDDVIQDYVMDVTSMDVNLARVSLTLGFEDLLNRPAVQVQFRPETTPGLF